MKIAIVQFPGSNCEQESARAISEAGMKPINFLWNQNYKILEQVDGYFVIGGFSYEDRARAGVIASVDPVMKVISTESKKGKPVLGICNGAQILVETGMVPGLVDDEVGVALAVNERIMNGKILGTGFYNAWIKMKLDSTDTSNAFTRHLSEKDIMVVPVAHAEGRFVIPDKLLYEMKAKGLTTFRYCDDDGEFADRFPVNPNGAVHNLSAISNASGNVMAMMPHPERTPNGAPIFSSMREYIKDNHTFELKTLNFRAKDVELHNHSKASDSFEILIEPIITDNEAGTVEKTLKNLGCQSRIKRYDHWEIVCSNEADTKEKIIKSGELFNSNKEKIVENAKVGEIALLVRYTDDFLGKSKLDALNNKFDVSDLKNITKGTLWVITIDNEDEFDAYKKIINSNILFNHYSQTCEIYKQNIPIGNTIDLQNNDIITNPNHMNYKEIIASNLKNTLTDTELGIGYKRTGKVRDRYELKDKLVLVTSDRQSAFDRILASIPFKGQVLNQTSAWWFKKTAHIVPNHVINIPDPNVTIAKKCKIFPVEFVVRGYITGTTDTSAWTNYQKGVRDFCGNKLPEGMVKNQKFNSPILTPTTKEDDHDRSITPEEIVEKGLMTQDQWDYVSEKALELFRFGQATAKQNGLILVDTKYEFGIDEEGTIRLVDEIHTPDSSRYWIEATYDEKFSRGEEPDNIDKEFLRLWFKQHSDPYNDDILPPAPEELVVELSRKYIQLYEMITGEKFSFPDMEMNIVDRIKRNVEFSDKISDELAEDSLEKINFEPEKVIITEYSRTENSAKAVIIMGSVVDEPFAKKISDKLTEYGIKSEKHIASAHKQASDLLKILDGYKDKSVIYITIAGRSNALSGFVAGNSDKIVIACPPFGDKTDMMINIHSTLQMPSNVPVMTVLDPGNCALAVKRIVNR